jgi:uncharacterized protein involved in outer membrane biogenesis
MKKKIILGLGLGFLVLLVAGVIVVGFFLGDLVKAGMEKVGPKITRTTLTVDAVSVSLLGGSAGVKGLVLGNPEGYKAPSAISVGKAAVSISPGSILSDKIVIRSVEVRNAEITFEGNPLGANNLTKLMDNVNALSAAANKAETNPPAAMSGDTKKPAKKLEVDDFLISGAKIHANLSGIPGLQAQAITLPLPDIHLTDLGKGNDGITAADLTKKVLGEVTTGTIKALTAAVADLGKDVAGAAKDAAQNAGKAAGEGVDKLKKGIGGLFGK